MSDFSKLPKGKKTRFGELPNLNEASNNLEAPEFAPAQTKEKTNRLEPLNFKVTREFKKEFKRVALENDKLLVELLEDCLEIYKNRYNI